MERRGDDGRSGSTFLRARYFMKHNPNTIQAITAITVPAIAPPLRPVEFDLCILILGQQIDEGDTVPLALATVDV
jgi:hypothetical protein